MDNLTVGQASKKDFLSIRRLIASVQINPIGLDWRRFLVVKNAAGRLIGCGQIKLHTDGSLELASIAVREESRGQGIASRIIKSLLLQEKKRPIYLMCRSALEPFYSRFGFRSIPVREMPSYFKRISHLAELFMFTKETGNHLLVMRLE